MKIKTNLKIFPSYITAIISFFYFTNLIPLISATQAPEINKEDSININYLKNFQDSQYILDVGDQITVIVSREYPELNSTVLISEDGTVYLPKLNKVFISGLTIKELTSVLNRAFLKFVKFPQVEIIINNYRPLSVLVRGEVAKSKIYILEGRLKSSEISSTGSDFSNNQINNSIATNFFPTVFDAIRASGGITDYADLTRVEIIRDETLSNNGGKKKALLNLLPGEEGKMNSQNIRIYSGDIITVPRRTNNQSNQKYDLLKNTLNPEFLKIMVAGKVEDPGMKLLPRNSTFNNALEISGGLQVLPGKLKIVRLKNNGTYETLKIKYNKRALAGSKNNPFLSNGDMIFVDKSVLNRTSEILTQTTAPFSGIFSVYGLLKAISE